MHTHFTMTGPDRGTWFSLDECEVCGRLVQAPNAVTHHHTKAQMIAKGFRFYDPKEQGFLLEIYWSDDHGCTACEACLMN